MFQTHFTEVWRRLNKRIYKYYAIESSKLFRELNLCGFYSYIVFAVANISNQVRVYVVFCIYMVYILFCGINISTTYQNHFYGMMKDKICYVMHIQRRNILYIIIIILVVTVCPRMLAINKCSPSFWSDSGLPKRPPKVLPFCSQG